MTTSKIVQETPIAIHARETSYLYIQKSGIRNAGMGLFTAIKIYDNEIISIFKGIILSPAKANGLIRQGKHDYFIDMLNGTTMDCAGTKCFAKYANDASGYSPSKKTNNAIITLDFDNKVCLVALRTINPGSEILCSYGSGYWKNR